MPTLQKYVLIEQDIADVVVFRRRANWFPEHCFLGDAVIFESINLTLVVEEMSENKGVKE
jgi:hypothetical protein